MKTSIKIWIGVGVTVLCIGGYFFWNNYKNNTVKLIDKKNTDPLTFSK